MTDARTQIAARGAQRLAAALENPQETDPYVLLSLGSTLAALTNEMEQEPAPKIAKQGAQRLAAALVNPQETAPYVLSPTTVALWQRWQIIGTPGCIRDRKGPCWRLGGSAGNRFQPAFEP